MAELQAVARELAAVQEGLDVSSASRRDRASGDVRSRVRALARRLRTAHRELLAGFDGVARMIDDHGLPPVIRDRHRRARDRYLERIHHVMRDMKTAYRDPAAARVTLGAVATRLDTTAGTRPAQSFDPVRLSHRPADHFVPAPTATLATGARSIGGADVATRAVQPTPEDLAENEDVQITGDVVALAASLGGAPVPIFDWVRNNVAFVPTFGSVQGSQMTLDARRGNAFDIATLLIALLRAAGVPARYVTGRVRIPLAAVRNWVGGTATAAITQQVLGQGGIDNVLIVSGGGAEFIDLDHVWVDAFVDFIPSRGAVHRDGDTWVPMDAAFKQHAFTPGSTILADLPVAVLPDPLEILDVDENLGRVTNVDDEVLGARLENVAISAQEYLTAHGLDGSLESLDGGRAIIRQTSPFLPGTLPYTVVSRGDPVATLPASLRHHVQVTGYVSELARDLGDADFSHRLSFPAINSRRLGVQFPPATPADQATLQAARDGGATSLPISLVQVVPALALDGVRLATGAPIGMGSDYVLDVRLEGPDGGSTVSYTVAAGDEIVVGVNGNGFTREVVQKRLAANPVDGAPEYLNQIRLQYWLVTDELNAIAGASLDVRVTRLRSVGLVSSPLTVTRLFDEPHTGVYEQRAIDVKQSLFAAIHENQARVVAFALQAGVRASWMEGGIFDVFTPAEIVDGAPIPRIEAFSAVELLRAAAHQGIPIYRVTPANAAAVLPLLGVEPEVTAAITDALVAGNTVVVPGQRVDTGLWSGVGYVILDERTGAGAYLITGGLDGGGLAECLEQLEPVFDTIVVVLTVLLVVLLAIYLLGPIIAALGAALGAAEVLASVLLIILTTSPILLEQA